MEAATAILGKEEIAKRHARWLSRAESEPDKFDRVLAEVRTMVIEKRIIKTPGAAAEDLWKRWK